LKPIVKKQHFDNFWLLHSGCANVTITLNFVQSWERCTHCQSGKQSRDWQPAWN